MKLYLRYHTVKLSKFGVVIFESTYSFVAASLFVFTGLPKFTIRLLFTKIFVEAENSVLF